MTDFEEHAKKALRSTRLTLIDLFREVEKSVYASPSGVVVVAGVIALAASFVPADWRLISIVASSAMISSAAFYVYDPMDYAVTGTGQFILDANGNRMTKERYDWIQRSQRAYSDIKPQRACVGAPDGEDENGSNDDDDHDDDPHSD